jgi:hypothetical protein
VTVLDCSYVVPVKWSDGALRTDLADYLAGLIRLGVETIVVDGSAADVFAANERAWEGSVAAHLAPDGACLNGKVAGVTTGIGRASREKVVIADDDVRYGPEELARTIALLDTHDLVRPQNYFGPLRWHARWDSARSVLNRSFGADFPGTLAIRRSRFLAMGGYDGDVLFENLELIRTVRAGGGRVASPLDLYVRRLPPTTAHFWSQRVRQAYDDFALPARMASAMALLPLLALSLRQGRRREILGVALLSIAVAERGRRRAGGRRVFPASASLLAPAWLLERGACAWLALWQRLSRGGVRYAGTTIAIAAHSERSLRRGPRRQGI